MREVRQAALFAAELERAIAAETSAVVMPVDALAKAAAAIEATGNIVAASTLRQRAQALLRERLEKLPDAETRAAYAASRFHRALLDAPTTSARSLRPKPIQRA